MPRLSQLLVSRDRQFFDLFEEAASNILRGADLLDQMLRGYPENAPLAREILICEQEGDRITHDIIHRLNGGRRRRMRIESADGYALATTLDDIVDYAEQTADALGLYRVEAPMEQAVALANVLVEAAEQVAQALRRLRTSNEYASELVEIHRLENEADRLRRDGVASLFVAGIDPMVVIRWKDIFESLEASVDACESVAHVLEGVALRRRRH